MPIPVDVILRKKERFVRDPDRVPPDFHEELDRLEEAGELVVQRIPEGVEVVEVPTKYGRPKRVPKSHLWHHKSCGQCGHIPGYSTSIFWVMRKLGYDYHDPKDQTSCTAWNYYASATSNDAAQAAVAVRNFAAAYETGYFPLIHCGTSYGHYKEVRAELLEHAELRARCGECWNGWASPWCSPRRSCTTRSGSTPCATRSPPGRSGTSAASP